MADTAPPLTAADLDRVVMQCCPTDRPAVVRLVGEVRRLRRLCEGLAERAKGQSELLSRRAEK